MAKIKIRVALQSLGCMLGVATVTGLLLVALSVLFYPKNNQQAFGMTNEAANGILGERKGSIDVLFVGDSEAFCSFSPLQMWGDHGFTSYVCATSGQELPYGNTLLRRATKNQRPRVVVIETHSIYTAVAADSAIMRTMQDVLPVFEFHNRWKSLTSGDLTTRVSTTYSDGLKGFRLDKSVVSADSTGHMAPSDAVEKIPNRNKQYVRMMVDYCRSIGAKPLLVSTPSTVCWNTARHNGMAAFAQEMGVDYIDLNTGASKVDIDWATETRDGGDHLNLAGAQKVSSYIGAYLSKTYNLPDHRGDSAYSSWNDSLERYVKQLQEA